MIVEAPLSPRQQAAIAALLREDTQDAAATAARVSVRTLRRWLDVPAFVTELARQRDRLVVAATLRLARGSDRAAAALVQMADGTTPASAARVAACRAVLEAVVTLTEFGSITARLASLERERSELPQPTGGVQ